MCVVYIFNINSSHRDFVRIIYCVETNSVIHIKQSKSIIKKQYYVFKYYLAF